MSSNISSYPDEEIHVCIICNQNIKGNKEFKKHINSYHSTKIIEIFDKNSYYNIELNQKNKKKRDIDSSKENEISKVKESIKKSNNENYKNNFESNQSRIETKNIIKEYNSNNTKSNENINESSINVKITHCNKEKLNCTCCKDKICTEGNCFCPKCMKLNIEKLKLNNHELINKLGNISERKKKKNGEIIYFCRKNYFKLIDTYSGKKKFDLICDSVNPCNECEKLTENMKIYENIVF